MVEVFPSHDESQPISSAEVSEVKYAKEKNDCIATVRTDLALHQAEVISNQQANSSDLESIETPMLFSPELRQSLSKLYPNRTFSLQEASAINKVLEDLSPEDISETPPEYIQKFLENDKACVFLLTKEYKSKLNLVAKKDILKRENKFKEASEKTKEALEKTKEASEKTREASEKIKEALEKTKEENEKIENSKKKEDLSVLENLGNTNLSGLKSLKLKIQEWKERGESYVFKGIDLVQEKLSKINKIIANLTAIKTLGKTPQEKAIISHAVDTASINLGATDPSEIYADVFSKISVAAIEDDDKKRLMQEVANKLGIHTDPNTTTGTRLMKSIESGHGTDPETGEPLPYTKKKPLQVRKGVTMYKEKPEDSAYRMELKLNGRSLMIDIPENLSGNQVGKVVNAIIVAHTFEEMGITDLFGRGFEATQGTDVYDVEYDMIHKSEMIMTNLLGGMAGFDGEILAQHDIGRLKHSIRWFLPNGDPGVNIQNDRGYSPLKELGIIQENGSIDSYLFEGVADFIQSSSATGKPCIETLKSEFINRYQPKPLKERPYTSREEVSDMVDKGVRISKEPV